MQMDFFLHFLHLKKVFFLCIFCIFWHFFASVSPSVSFYCGNPETSLCHMHHFDMGGGGGKCVHLHFFCIACFAVSTYVPPSPPATGSRRVSVTPQDRVGSGGSRRGMSNDGAQRRLAGHPGPSVGARSGALRTICGVQCRMPERLQRVSTIVDAGPGHGKGAEIR